jgi:hypothetical protein
VLLNLFCLRRRSADSAKPASEVNRGKTEDDGAPVDASAAYDANEILTKLNVEFSHGIWSDHHLGHRSSTSELRFAKRYDNRAGDGDRRRGAGRLQRSIIIQM